MWYYLRVHYYYYIDVVSIQIVPHWGTNRECGTNQGNKVSLVIIHAIAVKLYDNSILYITLLTLPFVQSEVKSCYFEHSCLFID